MGGLLTWPVGHNLGHRHRQAVEEVRAAAALFAVVDGCVVNFPDALRVGVVPQRSSACGHRTVRRGSLERPCRARRDRAHGKHVERATSLKCAVVSSEKSMYESLDEIVGLSKT